jgi:hypothetical protein
MALMKGTVLILGFILIVFGTSCSAQQQRDVSDSQKFERRIGSQYRTNIDLQIRGLSSDRQQDVDSYLVIEPEKTEHYGPEVSTIEVLVKGSKFQIVRVLECSNCFLSPATSIEIQFENRDIYGRPVYIPYHEFERLLGAGGIRAIAK